MTAPGGLITKGAHRGGARDYRGHHSATRCAAADVGAAEVEGLRKRREEPELAGRHYRLVGELGARAPLTLRRGGQGSQVDAIGLADERIDAGDDIHAAFGGVTEGSGRVSVDVMRLGLGLKRRTPGAARAEIRIHEDEGDRARGPVDRDRRVARSVWRARHDTHRSSDAFGSDESVGFDDDASRVGLSVQVEADALIRRKEKLQIAEFAGSHEPTLHGLSACCSWARRRWWRGGPRSGRPSLRADQPPSEIDGRLR